MSELEERLYEYFKTNSEYRYSHDNAIKAQENAAIQALSDSCLIRIKCRSIGYVIAEVCE